MITNIISILVAILILFIGESLHNETKAKYIEKGYSWSRVILYSNLSAIIGGILSIIIIEQTGMGDKWNPSLLVFAITISSYITTQSFMTDLRILLINRKVLRISYLSMYAVSLYNVITNDLFRSNWVALVLFTVLLILIFIFSSIGASDVRAIAVLLPYVISIGGYDGIILFVITLLLVSAGMGIRNVIRDRHRMKRFKESNIDVYNKMNKLLFYKLARDMIKKEKTPEESATPVGPYMISPFLIFLLIFPFMI